MAWCIQTSWDFLDECIPFCKCPICSLDQNYKILPHNPASGFSRAQQERKCFWGVIHKSVGRKNLTEINIKVLSAFHLVQLWHVFCTFLWCFHHSVFSEANNFFRAKLSKLPITISQKHLERWIWYLKFKFFFKLQKNEFWAIKCQKIFFVKIWTQLPNHR